MNDTNKDLELKDKKLTQKLKRDSILIFKYSMLFFSIILLIILIKSIF